MMCHRCDVATDEARCFVCGEETDAGIARIGQSAWRFDPGVKTGWTLAGHYVIDREPVADL